MSRRLSHISLQSLHCSFVSDGQHPRRIVVAADQTDFGLGVGAIGPLNSTSGDEQFRVRSDLNIGYPRHKPYINFTKWNLCFDGIGSVVLFLEDLEEMCESRGVSESRLFQSISEFLRDDALLWYRPRRANFRIGQILKYSLETHS